MNSKKGFFSFYNIDWLDGFVSGVVLSAIVMGITVLLSSWRNLL